MSVKETRLQHVIDGVQTAIRVVGKGYPVVFLHGAATLEGMDALDALSGDFKIFYPSHPGMGYSGDASHIVDMTDMLIHYLNLLDAMQLPEKPHLIGLSMGGWMASELAGIARERFNKIVLIAPAGLNDPAHPATDISAIPPAEFPGFLAHKVDVALRYFPDAGNRQAVEAFTAARGRESAMVERLMKSHGMGRPNLRHFLRRITNPALVVWGEKDRIVPSSQICLWVEEMPNARALIVPDAGHFVLQEQPGVVLSIREFLLSSG